MKILSYLILFLILCNIPNFVYEHTRGTSLGSLFYMITYGFLLLYYFINEKNNIAWPFLIFGITFFIFSGLIFIDEETVFINDFIKYIIIIVCGGELARNTKLIDIYNLLLVGAFSIIIHVLFFVANDGRYSGFFDDPNVAGFSCLMGCAFSFGLRNERIKLLGFFFFTFCGVLTFSRTFLLLWFIVLIIAVINEFKNIKLMLIGLGALILVLSTAAIFEFNTARFSFLTNLFQGNIETKIVTDDSRTDIWSLYYDLILQNPIFGNGYKSFSGGDKISAGVHNTYLRIIGESGIIPFMVFLLTYIFMLLKSMMHFIRDSFLFLIIISIMALLLTNHNFVVNNHITFISIWVYFRLTNSNNSELKNSTLINIRAS